MEFNLATGVNQFDIERRYEVDDADAKVEMATSLLINPDALHYNGDLFEAMVELVHGLLTVSRSARKQVVYLVTSGLMQVAPQVAAAVAQGHFDDDDLKSLLEKYTYLQYVVVKWLGKEELPRLETRKKASAADEHAIKINNHQVEDSLAAMIQVLQITQLDRVFVNSTERDQYVELFSRPTVNLMEDADRMKRAPLRLLIYKVLALSVSIHKHDAIIQHSISQCLQYYNHLAPYLAELMVEIATKYDFPKLVEDVLLELGNANFDSADTNGPKQVSELLVGLSSAAPRLVSRQLAAISQLLDNNNVYLRNGVVESCGLVVKDMVSDVEDIAPATDGLLTLLEQRVMDVHYLVRSKAIQALTKVSDSDLKQPKRRLRWMALAVNQLDDKSTVVRRNSIKLMNSLLTNHPFPGSQLKSDAWMAMYDQAKQQFESVGGHVNPDADADVDVEEPATEDIVRARLTLELCDDALTFIKEAILGTEKVAKLLFSKSKQETIESMDFLVLADAHGIDSNEDGIRRMLHLVWSKVGADEGVNAVTVVGHLIDCYRQLYLSPPPTAPAQQAQYMAKNLVKLTFGASASDFASLEKLLGLLYKAKHISIMVVDTLWAIYASERQRESVRQGAIIILGMIASVERNVVATHVNELIAGLASDDHVVCKYTCVALQRLGSETVPRVQDIIQGLRRVLVKAEDDPQWFSVAEQAVSAIFKLCRDPDVICAEIIKEKSLTVFKDQPNPLELGQLLYVVGDVALKLMVSLEAQEAMFKKKKHDLDMARSQSEQPGEVSQQQELEMIGGTSEDDFADAITHVKERELLYGETSLLSRFGPLVVEICSNNHLYNHSQLQRAATLCLSKLMCVSSVFCEEHLGLFITIMEKSDDPLIRCNCVLGLGDMAVCFNNIVDERTDFLYRRLNDEDVTVQRTCLMTVTFLILAGQVKVKGQLSSMAKCLMDSDPTIADMCKLFFAELSTKDNAIYNGFIDMFSGLSADTQLNRDSFKKILRYLVGFIDKERQQRQLAEKLFVRLNSVDTKQKWDDVAFVLGILPYKADHITAAIESGFKYVQDRKIDD